METGLDTEATLSVRNMGGIEETTIDISSGVNILQGRNATNRTSLLRSIMTVLGSNDASLKADADEGWVELTVGDATYDRTFERTSEGVVRGGTPYSESATKADLFAFLLETNEARRAVAQGNDLRDIIMRPVDTDEIEKQIRAAKKERSRLDDRIAELEAQGDRLESLKGQKSNLLAEIENTEDQIETLEERLDRDNSENARAEQTDLEEKLTALSESRNELDDVKNKIDSAKEERKAFISEQESLRKERNELSTSIDEISEVGTRIGRLQERKRTLDSTLDRLQSVIQFNQDILENEDPELQEAFIGKDGHITNQLVTENNVVCWTCGSNVNREDIDKTIDQLRAIRSERMEERQNVIDELDELRKEKQRIEERQQRRDQIDHRLEQIADHLDQQDERVETLEHKATNLEDTIKETQRAVDEIERTDTDKELIDLNKRVGELEATLKNQKAELADINTDIESIENGLEESERLQEKRGDIKDQLTELRERIESLEGDAIDAFNNHMNELIELLGYENIERIWIERQSVERQRGRQTVSETEFEMHVVRTTESDVVYEDTVSHLSESEREVTGLVFALAGYLVHDLHAEIPFILLDSLEAIDSTRIATLVEYFAEYADYLVVALLPEDAEAVSDDHRYISRI